MVGATMELWCALMPLKSFATISKSLYLSLYESLSNLLSCKVKYYQLSIFFVDLIRLNYLYYTLF